MTCRMEPATWNAQLHQQRVKLFFHAACFAENGRPTTVDEQQVSFAFMRPEGDCAAVLLAVMASETSALLA